MIEFTYPIIVKELTNAPFEEDETELELGAFGSPGGKSHIVLKLMKLVPEHDTYIEPFAGGAALYWKKEPVKLEILNDLDEEIAHAYKFIRGLDKETIEKVKNLDWKGNKSKFFKLRDLPIPKDNLQRFYKFFYVHFHSYGASRKTFGYKNCEPKCFDKYLGFSERMKNTKIFSDDYAKVIQKFDSPSTFIYLDPPYPNEWPGHTGTKAWGEKDVKRLHSVLKNCESKWLLSINELDWIKKIFNEFSIHKILVPRKFRKGDEAKYELLISNYEIKNLDESVEDLKQKFPGVVIENAYDIWNGSKQPIMLKEEIKAGENLYFMNNKYCYGILKLKDPIKGINGILYNFDIIDKFEDAKPIEENKDKIFIEDTKFMSDWSDLKFIDGLSDFTIIKDCISVIGSTITQEHKPNDIDLLIRMNEPPPFIKRAIEVRLSKMLPKEFQDKLHFVWGEKEGPHDSFMPIYDLTFRKISNPSIVRMINELVELMKPYLPQKPYGSAYYDLNKFIDILL